MNAEIRTLATRHGVIRFPAYVPVTTFGKKYPLDELIRPFLPRLAQAAMVSYYYARQMEAMPDLPLFVDSGGFVSLFHTARVVNDGKLGAIELTDGDKKETIHPASVLALQEQAASVAFTLDFPISPGADADEAHRRQELTIANALWAQRNRRRRDLRLYACVQGWDVDSVRACARAYASETFDGLALGGVVPRVHNMSLVLDMVKAVRQEIGELPLHVFGIGNPALVEQLFQTGMVDSVDSSWYVKLAAEGRLWSNPEVAIEQPTITDRLHLALCNLAAATQRELPLSVARIAFHTQALAASRVASPSAARRMLQDSRGNRD